MNSSNSTTVPNLSTMYQLIPLKLLVPIMLSYGTAETLQFQCHMSLDRQLPDTASAQSLLKLSSSALSKHCKSYTKIDLVKFTMCSLEHNYCTSTTVDRVKTLVMNTNAFHPISVDTSEDNSSLETEVIIESMVAEVPLITALVEKDIPTQHIKETINRISESNDHPEAENELPVTVVDAETTEDYIV